MRSLVATLSTGLLLAMAAPVPAQEGGLTLAQVERKYRSMNEVHILKCDYNGDGIFTKTEMICVQNIYNSLYLNRN